RHEDVFIRLWDDLRSQEDEFAVLESFSFGELILGQPAVSTDHSHGIKVTGYGGPGRELAWAQWRQLLEAFRKEGYRIEQTEWRQPSFTPGPPARSVMYAVAHVLQPAIQRRFIL